MQPPPRNYVAGLYWRKSKINGRKTVPVILRLHDGMLYLTGQDGPVFAVPVSQVAATFSKLGTMTLQSPGGSVDIVGRGGAVAPFFSPAQLAELQASGADGPTMGLSNNPHNILALGNTGVWRDVLGYAGARVT